MNKGCRVKYGDIKRGLKIVSEPYKINGDKNYRAMVKCQFCDKPPYEIILSEINRHVFDGCGCQKNRSNSPNWKSFESWCIDNNSSLLDLWDYNLNNDLPSDVSCCTANEYYFKCPCGIHESEKHKLINLIRRDKRVKPICKKCNSIAQHLIDKYGKNALDIYWDYELNTKDPWKLSFGTSEFVWIKCPTGKHQSYFRRIGDLIQKDIGCPVCALIAETSSYQLKTSSYILDIYGYKIMNERECSIIAINPKNNYQMPYDNEILICESNLIIEVHGQHHYDEKNGLIKLQAKERGITPNEVLKYQKWKDEYKKQYAIDKGYHYLALPYWTFKDDTYKSIIDNKISEILSLTTQN